MGFDGMREIARSDEEASEVAKHMLAAGVIIADYEERFEREGGVASQDFHAAWEMVVERWWELAARYEELGNRSDHVGQSIDHSASIHRISKLPQGFVC